MDKRELVETMFKEIREEGRVVGRMQGLMEGEAKGLTKGKAESFLRVARLKFGEIPPDRVEQVRGAASGELDVWLDALFSAEDLHAVFAARSIH